MKLIMQKKYKILIMQKTYKIKKLIKPSFWSYTCTFRFGLIPTLVRILGKHWSIFIAKWQYTYAKYLPILFPSHMDFHALYTYLYRNILSVIYPQGWVGSVLFVQRERVYLANYVQGVGVQISSYLSGGG
jgi:hypothetical protein